MLTATYAILNLSVEQEHARSLISKIQQFCRHCSAGLKDINLRDLKSVANQLTQFDESGHRRKVEQHVIPAIRDATREAAPLLDELASLNAQDESLLTSLKALLSLSSDQWMQKLKELNCLMKLYCQILLKKLEKEDALFALAQRLVPSEVWFRIGTQFLSLDAQNHPHKQSGDAMQTA